MSLTQAALRRLLITKAIPESDYLLAIPSSSAVTSVTFNQYANLYDQNHWKNGEIVASVSAATVAAKRISASNGSGETITVPVAWGSAPDTDAISEVIRSNWTFLELNTALQQAIRSAQRSSQAPVESRAIMLERNRMAYPMASGFSYLRNVYFDNQRPNGGDRVDGSDAYDLADRGVRDATARTKAAQRIYLYNPMTVESVWIHTAMLGTISSGNLTLEIDTESASFPSGTAVGGTATVTASTLSTTPGWVRCALSRPALLMPLTAYWIVVGGTYTVSASNYLTWRYRTAAAYANGQMAVYDGSSWSNASEDGHYLFRIVSTSPDWQELTDEEYDVDNAPSTPELQLWPGSPGLKDATPVLLKGMGGPTAISADTDTTNADPVWLIAEAAAMLLEDRAMGKRDALQQALAFRQTADRQLERVRRRRIGKVVSPP